MSHDDDDFLPLDNIELAFTREEPTFEQIERSVLLERLEAAVESEEWNECEQCLYLVLLEVPDSSTLNFAREFLLATVPYFEANNSVAGWTRAYLESPSGKTDLVFTGERNDNAIALYYAIEFFDFAYGKEEGDRVIPLSCTMAIRQAIYARAQTNSSSSTALVKQGWGTGYSGHSCQKTGFLSRNYVQLRHGRKISMVV